MRKAQSVLEYAVVVMAVVLALLTMQVYIKRGVQDRLKQVGNDLGQQYDPKNTTGTSTITRESNTTTTTTFEDANDDGKMETITTTNIDETEHQGGRQDVGPLQESLF